ncbi:hypothetical protein DPMN_178981 [Dreissena polymorpha]|uniref:Uncharacterized protein n=1 Tax=Dreissena polymorpha TaxID=45954 RepID=A0A9D4EBK9_DREPO|nr:hypothetical protein DPMN_178981 [Dreissena polymorpha]
MPPHKPKRILKWAFQFQKDSSIRYRQRTATTRINRIRPRSRLQLHLQEDQQPSIPPTEANA